MKAGNAVWYDTVFFVYKNQYNSGGDSLNIVRAINNNVVGSLDDKGREIIVMGKGIGFQKKTGDTLDEELIEKVFHLPDESQNQFEQLIKEIPYEHMKLASEIIAYVSEHLGKKLSKSIYITLTDHLNCAIERKKQGFEFQNALLWEIKKYYGREYEAGVKALQMVKESTGVELPEDEAGFLALHILNAEVDGNIQDSMSMPGMVKDILNIVKYKLNIEIDDECLAYDRFITHLKFFIQRAVTKKYYASEDEPEAFREFIKKCPEEYACAKKIRAYIHEKTEYDVSDEELLYLTMHIYRLKRNL